MAMSFRPTMALRARPVVSYGSSPGACTTNSAAAVGAPAGGTSVAGGLGIGGGYFKGLNSRRVFPIAQLVGMRGKYVAAPPNIPELDCMESPGHDDALTWGLGAANGQSTPFSIKSLPQISRLATQGRIGSRSTSNESSPRHLSSSASSSVRIMSRSAVQSTLNSPRDDKDATGAAPEPVIPLTQSENRWRPTQSTGFDKVQRKLNGMLNKLTVDKFDSLTDKFTELAVQACTSPEKLQQVVKLVFDKAIVEANFGDMYPRLCVKLASKLPPVGPNARVTFKSVMLQLCQLEFEEGYREIERLPEHTDEDVEELRIKQKQRILGNMQFIGELYKHNMLNSKIIMHCFEKLASSEQTEDLESMCSLLTTVGKTLDDGARKPRPTVNKAQLEEAFERVKELSELEGVALRTRFLLKDVLDLRANFWIPRRRKTEAKKIEELRAAAGIPSQQQQQQATARSLFQATVDPLRLRYGLGQSDSGRSSPGLSSTASEAGTRDIGSQGDKSTSNSRRSRRKNDRYSRIAQSGRVVSPSKVLTDKDLASRYEISSVQESTEGVPVEEEDPAPGMDPALVRRKAKGMAEEFVSSNDKKELVLCVGELKDAKARERTKMIVAEALNIGMESPDERSRTQAVALIQYLHSTEHFATPHIAEAIAELLELMPDLVVDLPIAPDRLGTMLGGLVAHNVIDRAVLSGAPDASAAVQKTLSKAAAAIDSAP